MKKLIRFLDILVSFKVLNPFKREFYLTYKNGENINSKMQFFL